MSAARSASVRIRTAAAHDFAEIAAIYGHYVRHATCTFELEPPPEAEMLARWEAVQRAGLPWLVAEDAAGRVAGYAYASRYRERPAYRHTVENSVYVANGRGGEGIGSRLLGELIARSTGGDFLKMVAIIGDSGNAASLALHARHGFRRVGVLEGVGFKHGRWLDTVIMQRSLC